MSIIRLLANDDFIAVNRTIAAAYGLDGAVILGEIASEYKYWSDRGELTEDGFFYSTVENMEKNTFMSAYSQREALKKLEVAGLITVKKMGMPAKRYIKIHEEQVLKAFNDKSSKNLTTSDENSSQQVVQFFDTNNNREKENKQKRIENKSKQASKATTFDEILDSVDFIRQDYELRETFVEFIKMRKLIKKPLTDFALKKIINEAYKLANGDPDTIKAIVEQSIMNSWQGVFELKKPVNKKYSNTKQVVEPTDDVEWNSFDNPNL